MTYYVYIYYDPRRVPFEPIYVGKGQRGRSEQHLKYAVNPILRRKLARIRAAGLEPVVVKEKENLTNTAASELERRLIRKLGRLDLKTGPLCNLTEGGEGALGRVVHKATRKLWSDQRKGKPQTAAQYAANCGRRQSAETRAKLSALNKGHKRHTAQQLASIKHHNSVRTISNGTRQLWSQQRRGVKQTPEHVMKVQRSIRAGLEQLRNSMSEQEWDAYRKKRFPSRTGKPHTDETKAKMREAWKRRKARLAEDE